MDRFEQNEKLRDRLVAAYLLGPVGCFPMCKFQYNFPSLHPCNGPLDTQCLIAFDHASPDSKALIAME